MQSRPQTSRANGGSVGFTLIEFMIALALAGVIVGLALPSARAFVRNDRLASASNDLLRSFQHARSDAIASQSDVVVCASENWAAPNPTCTYGAFNGWIVFRDANSNAQVDSAELILERHAPVDPSLVVRIDHDGIQAYDRTGFARAPAARSPTRTILICDDRGTRQIGGSSGARAVLIENTGRARVTRDPADIGRALAAVGSACP
jgi:prepilin-type N-terminal cleavage/methylation domain-containing protein